MILRVLGFLLCSSIFFVAQSYGQTKLLIGDVIAKKDSSKLIGVHVINISSNRATNSAQDGSIALTYTNGDTIILTAIGYNDHVLYTDMFWVPSGQKISIYMSEKVYDLPGVDVNQYSSKEEFREEFKNLEPAERVNQELFEYNGPTELEDVKTDLNAHVKIIESPITYLYSKLGKEARRAKKLAIAQEKTKKEQIIKEKYNPSIVMKVLELETSLDAKKFMEDCPLEDDFILRAKEYDIVKAILDCKGKESGTNYKR